MKSITIHKIEEPLNTLLRERAKSEGLSLNRTVKKLLEEALGVRPKADEERRKDFLELFGRWSRKEAREFRRRLGDLEKVDPKDWT